MEEKKVIWLLQKKFTIIFLKLEYLLANCTAKNAAKKTFLLTRHFLTLIFVNIFLCYDFMLIYAYYDTYTRKC